MLFPLLLCKESQKPGSLAQGFPYLILWFKEAFGVISS